MTLSAPIAEPGAGIGYRARPSLRSRIAGGRAGPVLVVLVARDLGTATAYILQLCMKSFSTTSVCRKFYAHLSMDSFCK